MFFTLTLGDSYFPFLAYSYFPITPVSNQGWFKPPQPATQPPPSFRLFPSETHQSSSCHFIRQLMRDLTLEFPNPDWLFNSGVGDIVNEVGYDHGV